MGSTKAVKAISEYFQERDIPCDEMLAEDRSDKKLLVELRSMDLGKYTAILIEYPVYPSSVRFVRDKYPQMRILVRSHNAEFYQYFHHALARARYFYLLSALSTLIRTSFKRLVTDYLCAKHSDYILSITLWEKENYWNKFADIAKVKVTPFYLTDFYQHDHPAETKKKSQCICLMTAVFTPLVLDAAMNFSRMVKMLGQRFPEWSFYITGDPSIYKLRLTERITATGFLKNPLRIQAESRAIALLSNYGFGFKTKILEAIQCKCYILIPRKLYRRLPEQVKPYCIVVDLDSVESFAKALDKSKLPYPDGNPNSEFREQAFASLDECFMEDCK